MLKIINVSKIYKTKYYTQSALSNVSIEFPKTGMIFVVGESGSGKSTLLNILGGIDKPDVGCIFLDGKQIDYALEKNMDAYRKNYVGFIFQKFNLINDYNIVDNIILSAQIQGKTPNQDEINNILKLVKMEKFAFHKANQLSIGQQQRVAIARSLIKEANIILPMNPLVI